MELLDFINSNENWRKKLAAKPYCIEIKDDKPYTILKYNMLESNFNLEIVKQCRGTIIKETAEGYVCVCYPFRKFGNYSESYADTDLIDWSLGVDVQEKIDGSLMKLFCDNGLWQVATNGTIKAFKAECGDSTFGDVFYSIIENHMRVKDFFARLNPHYTYMFEMVHPLYNPIVIHYSEPAIYYLGRRNMETFEEDQNRNDFYLLNWLKFPKHYHYKSLYECIETAHNLGDDAEGYVVTATNQKVNGSFLRVKVKGDKYLELHRLRGNGPLTIVKVVSLWQEDSLDDFLAYFPEHSDFVAEVYRKIIDLIEKADIAYDVVKGTGSRKDFAFRAQSYIKPIQSYLFARLDNKVDCANTYFKNMKPRNLAELIKIGGNVSDRTK